MPDLLHRAAKLRIRNGFLQDRIASVSSPLLVNPSKLRHPERSEGPAFDIQSEAEGHLFVILSAAKDLLCHLNAVRPKPKPTSLIQSSSTLSHPLLKNKKRDPKRSRFSFFHFLNLV